MPGLDVFRDHNRVINQQSDHDNQAEHGQQVQCDTELRHEHEGAADRSEQSDSHPECDSPIQKKQKGGKDQQRTPFGVAHQQVEPAFNEPSQIGMRDQFAIRRNRFRRIETQVIGLFRYRIQEQIQDAPIKRFPSLALDIGANDFSNFHGILIPHPKNGQGGGSPRIFMGAETRFQLLIDVILLDCRQIPHPQRLSACRGPDHNVADGVATLLDPDGAHTDIPDIRPHRSAGYIHHPTTDGVADLRQADAIFHQLGFGNVHTNFVLPHPGDQQFAHARQGFQIIMNPTNAALEYLLIHLPEQGDHDHGHFGFHQRDLDLLGILGQVGQCIDGAFDLIDGLIDVTDPVHELDENAPAPFHEGGGQFLNLLEVRQLVLDLHGQGFFNLFRGRPGEGKRDVGRFRGYVGKKFLFERETGIQAAHDDRAHEKIHGNRPADAKPGQAHLAGSFADSTVAAAPSGNTGSTDMPSASERVGVITTNAPGGSGDSSTTHKSSGKPKTGKSFRT